MIQTLTDINECRQAWDAISPGKVAWDDWDLMFAFHDEVRYRFNFLVQRAGNDPEGPVIGLIPLVHDTTDGSYELFGGCYPDSRVLWLKLDDFPVFYDCLPDTSVFFDLKGGWVEELLGVHPGYAGNFVEEDQRYFLKPAKFDYDFVNHINTFSGDKRKGFLYDLRKIREKGPVLRWSQDDEADLFIELSNKRFGAESDYATEAGQGELRRVIRELKASGNLQTLIIDMDGSPHAVSMSAHFGDAMIALYSTSNMDYKNLGKLLNVETIQRACQLRVDEISYMTGMAWKAQWNMDSEAVRTFRKTPKPPEPAPVSG